jgi:hypothetical protein
MRFQPIHNEADKTKEYRAWTSMKSRCYYQEGKDFERYGGKGVIVCDRWRHSYANFLADVGRSPSKLHSLDRWPNKNGNYEPGNIRWATSKEQSNNLRNNVKLTFKGEELTIPQWSERISLSIRLLHKRVRLGWSTERILTEPVSLRHATMKGRHMKEVDKKE